DIGGTVVFSPDEQHVMTSEAGNVLRIWDAETGEQLLEMKGDANNARFSPDGRQIVSWDIGVRVWDAATGKMLMWSSEGHVAGAAAARFTADGRQVVSCGIRDHCVKFWDLATGRLVRKIAIEGEYSAFHPD